MHAPELIIMTAAVNYFGQPEVHPVRMQLMFIWILNAILKEYLPLGIKLK